MSVKYVTMGLISKVDKGAYSNIVLNDAFREFFLSPKEKAFMTEIFYGVIRNKKFLDYIIERYTKDIRKEWIRNLLRISIYQITFMNSDDKGVVWEATELAKKYSIAISKFINGTLRNYLRNKDSELKKLDDEKNYPYQLNISRMDNAIYAHVNEIVWELVEIAESLDGYYDGWGCNITK